MGEKNTRYTECVLVIGIRDKTVIDDESKPYRVVQTALEHNTSKEFYNKLLVQEEKKEEKLSVKKFNSKDGLFKIYCAKNPIETDPCEDHPFLCLSKHPLCLLEARELKKE